MTGDPRIDHVLEIGHRAFDADLPHEIRDEIAKSNSLNWFKDWLTTVAREELARLNALIRGTCMENRFIESTAEFKACNGLGFPECRIPEDVHYHFAGLYGIDCWKDDDFREDFLNHYPGLRLKVTRGTRGQEYAGNGR